MQSIFINATFLQFWAFLLVFTTILGRDHMEICFCFKYTYLKEYFSVFKIILWFMHHALLPLKHCNHRKKIELWWTVSLNAWQISWKFEPNLLITMEVFQNIYFPSCDILGINAYFNKNMLENCIFCDFEAWSLAVPMRSHALFYFLHYNSIPRPTLKSCSFPIHRPGETKNSHKPAVGKNFFGGNLFV